MALKDYMARSGPEPARPEPSPVTAPRPATPSPAYTTCLGPTITLTGELRCGESLRIDWSVKGDIKARRKITLESTARVTGDLTTPGIVIQEGARLEGRIMIGGGPPPEAAQTPAPKPRAQEKVAAGSADVPARTAVIASGA